MLKAKNISLVAIVAREGQQDIATMQAAHLLANSTPQPMIAGTGNKRKYSKEDERAQVPPNFVAFRFALGMLNSCRSFVQSTF